MDERRAGRTVDAMVKRGLLRFIEGSSRTLLSRSRRLHHRLVHMYTLGQLSSCNKPITSQELVLPLTIDLKRYIMVNPLKSRNPLKREIRPKSTHRFKEMISFFKVTEKKSRRLITMPKEPYKGT